MMVKTVKHKTISVSGETGDAMNIADREAGIAEFAYLKAENRSFEPGDGDELEDWLEAEQEFCGSRKE
jgi:hypothetical protein